MQPLNHGIAYIIERCTRDTGTTIYFRRNTGITTIKSNNGGWVICQHFIDTNDILRYQFISVSKF